MGRNFFYMRFMLRCYKQDMLGSSESVSEELVGESVSGVSD
jgi:hypothetical protein